MLTIESIEALQYGKCSKVLSRGQNKHLSQKRFGAKFECVSAVLFLQSSIPLFIQLSPPEWCITELSRLLIYTLASD